MRKTVLVAAALASFALVPSVAQAQVTLGPALAFGDSNRDLGLGVALALPADALGPGFGFLFDFLYFFPDVGDYLEINGNVTYDFPLENSTAVPFVLGGLNISNSSLDIPGVVNASSTDAALNLGGGISFDLGNFRPRVLGRFQVGDGSGLQLVVTLPFAIGS